MKYVVWCIKDRKGNINNRPYHYSWRPENINEAYKAIDQILTFFTNNKFELEVREWNE